MMEHQSDVFKKKKVEKKHQEDMVLPVSPRGPLALDLDRNLIELVGSDFGTSVTCAKGTKKQKMRVKT